MSQIGTAFQTTTQIHGLSPGFYYRLVASLPRKNTLLLALFGKHKTFDALLLRVDRDAFETALINKVIFRSEQQFDMPPHLCNFSGINFAQMNSDRTLKMGWSAVDEKSYGSRVRKRLAAIQPLLDREAEIFSSANPVRLINQYARAAHLEGDPSGGKVKQQNANRIRYWFFSYICHGRNLWSLMPAFVNNGNWNRDDREPHLQSGAISKVPERERTTALSPEMVTQVINGYNRHVRVGKAMTKIYQDFLAYDVKALIIESVDGRKRLICPDKTPVPTFDQFCYRIKKTFGLSGIRRASYGSHKYRRRFAEQLGRFSENLSSIMERSEEDAEYSKARPAGLIHGQPIDPLVTTRAVDGISGFQFALGFGYATEDGQAYKDLMFCAAIDKVEWCALFGMVITPEQWPSRGLPQHRVSDRGPGMKLEADRYNSKTGEFAGTVLREITPSGMGQSKASVETSNEKIRKLEGPSSMLVSNLTPVQMIQRDISRLIEANHTLDMSARMTPEMKLESVRPTPIRLWNWYDDRARTRAQPIAYEDAVRQYLRKVDVTIKRDGAYLKYQRYTSQALSDTKLPERIADLGVQHVDGYVLNLCVRYIWIEINNCIIKVKAELPTNDDEEQLYISFAELLSTDSNHRIQNLREDENRLAESVQAKQNFKALTGKKRDETARIRAVPARKKAKSQEDRDLMNNRFKG